MSNCFVCLNPARRKICPKCECYAHNRCWGKYLQSVNSTYTDLIDGEVVVITPWALPCPQCRQHVLEVKPITRSDTDFARNIVMARGYASFLSALERVESDDEKYTLYVQVLEMLAINMTVVRKNSSITTLLKDRLRLLYADGWSAANLYYHRFFGRQIADKN